MSPKRTKPKGTMREWRITLARTRGQYLGLVEAPDEAAAVAEATKLFNVRIPKEAGH